MPADPSAGRRVLHVRKGFGLQPEDLRLVAMINRFGPGVSHLIVPVTAGSTAGIRHLAREVDAQPGQLPHLGDRAGPLRLEALAQAMSGHDLILTYGNEALHAVLAHTMFARRLGLAPLVHHEHGLAITEARARGWRESAWRILALARTAALVVATVELERVALASWRQPAAKVHRIPPGIETGAFARRPPPDALPRVVKRDGERFVGTDETAPAQLCQLLQAVTALPANWHLVILGAVPQREAVLAKAVAFAAGHRVHLPGVIAAPAKVLGLCDVFVPAANGGFPLPLVEAMAAGVAIAGIADGEAPQLVSPTNRRFLVQPGDERALAAGLAELAADTGMRARVGSDNRAKAVAEFDHRAGAARHGAVYAQVLGRSSFP